MQKIEAGKTPVGTPVEAKLVMATLMSGRVVPRDAVLLGHVEQSQPKHGNEPSTLRIAIDTVRWNSGEMKISGYLTSRYHPLAWDDSPDLSDGTDGSGLLADRRARRQQMMRVRTQGHMDERPADQRTTNAPDVKVGVSPNSRPIAHVTQVVTPAGDVTLSSAARTIKLSKNTVYTFVAAPEGQKP
jgi:hypothetical protein